MCVIIPLWPLRKDGGEEPQGTYLFSWCAASLSYNSPPPNITGLLSQAELQIERDALTLKKGRYLGLYWQCSTQSCHR
jgi:hypothetical protein